MWNVCEDMVSHLTFIVNNIDLKAPLKHFNIPMKIFEQIIQG